MAVAVLVLIVAILGMVGVLVYDIVTSEETPFTVSDRDILLYSDEVAKNPEDAEARISLARALLAAEDHEAALEQADRALGIKARHPGALYARGMALRLMGRYEEAVADFDEVLELIPDEAEALLQKGLALEARGDLTGAVAAVERSVEQRSTASDVRVQLGRLYEKQGAKDRAIEQYKAALRFVPGYMPALQALERLGTTK